MSIRGQRKVKMGKETYTVHFDFNALAELEDACNMSVPEIAKQMENPEKVSITFIRALTWAGMLKHHELSVQEVGELLSQADMNTVFPLIGEAFATSLISEEQAKQLEAQQADQNHQKKVSRSKKK